MITCITNKSRVLHFYLYTASTTAIHKPTRLETIQVSTQLRLSRVDI